MRTIIGATRARPSFTADLSGDVVATIAGHATFSRSGPSGMVPALDLGLGLLGVQGAVLFTLSSDSRSGRLTIVSATDRRITGRFVLSAVGERSREPLRVVIRGSFVARAA